LSREGKRRRQDARERPLWRRHVDGVDAPWLRETIATMGHEVSSEDGKD